MKSLLIISLIIFTSCSSSFKHKRLENKRSRLIQNAKKPDNKPKTEETRAFVNAMVIMGWWVNKITNDQ